MRKNGDYRTVGQTKREREREREREADKEREIMEEKRAIFLFHAGTEQHVYRGDWGIEPWDLKIGIRGWGSISLHVQEPRRGNRERSLKRHKCL